MTIRFRKPAPLAAWIAAARVAAVLWLAVGGAHLHAQESLDNPYSGFGLGERYFPASSRNLGLASTGIALAHPLQQNRINPASLTDLILVNFDLSGIATHARITDGTNTRANTIGSLQSLNFGFPAGKYVALGLALQPYTRMSYEAESFARTGNSIDSFTVRSTNTGSGGVNEASFSVATRLMRKRLSLGADMQVFFGQVTRRIGNEFLEQPNTSFAGLRQDANVRGLGTRLGVQYTDTLRQDTLKGKALLWRVGAIYELPFSTTVRQNNQLEYGNRQSPTTLPFGQGADTRQNLPTAWGLGVALDWRDEKQRPYMTWGLDFLMQDWSAFAPPPSPTADAVSVELGTQYRISTGIEWVPNLTSLSFFGQSSYRLGLSQGREFYTVAGESVNNWLVSAGWGLPIPKTFSRVNIALAYGSRGRADAPLLGERFAQVAVGVCFSEMWFMKRKYQ
jgi:hypothetical protein